MPPSTVVGAPVALIGRFCSAGSVSIWYCGRLQRDRIGDAVLLVEPVGGRHLAGAGQVDDQAVGHVGGGHAGVLGARAVDIDVDRRLPGRLLDARIGHAGDMADLRQELVGVGIVRAEIVAADLQIDRRRRAEIEDLADDIGGQKREGHAGETARQLIAQATDVAGGRRVPLVERDLDVSVRLADRAGVVVDRVDRRKIGADIVHDRRHFGRRDHLADRLLHIGETRCGFLDTHADRRPHMQQHLAAVDLREEIAAEKWRQQERDGDEAEKPGDEQPAMLDGERQQIVIPGAQPCMKPPRSRAESAPADSSMAGGSDIRAAGGASYACAADISPSSAPACATAGTRRPSRTSRSPPSARTGSARRRSGRTSE